MLEKLVVQQILLKQILKAGRGKYTEYLKMNIEFYDKGKSLYDFYIEDKDGNFLYALTTSQAEGEYRVCRVSLWWDE